VGVSRVGFNPEGNQALIYMEHGCGTLCATGNFILLQKGPGGWKITQRYTPWIS
jgi:hypothetical protein